MLCLVQDLALLILHSTGLLKEMLSYHAAPQMKAGQRLHAQTNWLPPAQKDSLMLSQAMKRNVGWRTTAFSQLE